LSRKRAREENKIRSHKLAIRRSLNATTTTGKAALLKDECAFQKMDSVSREPAEIEDQGISLAAKYSATVQRLEKDRNKVTRNFSTKFGSVLNLADPNWHAV